jgi:hypothetical protein
MTPNDHNELLHKLAQHSLENADIATLKAAFYDEQLGYFSGMDTDELAELVEEMNFVK